VHAFGFEQQTQGFTDVCLIVGDEDTRGLWRFGHVS
jgi:hypothetical protein